MIHGLCSLFILSNFQTSISFQKSYFTTEKFSSFFAVLDLPIILGFANCFFFMIKINSDFIYCMQAFILFLCFFVFHEENKFWFDNSDSLAIISRIK